MAKLAGVLIEVQPLAEGCLVVIGIGVNHNSAMLTRGSIEQDVADVAEVAPTIGRNRLLAMLINGLADYVTQFERDGFGGMVDAWESLHAYQGCDLVLESGANSIVGTVVGVTDRGELKLRTQQGVEIFNAGEVSLRRSHRDAL